MPLECLLAVEELEQSAEGQQTVFELHQIMVDAKTIFSGQNICRNVIDVMETELTRVGLYAVHQFECVRTIAYRVYSAKTRIRFPHSRITYSLDQLSQSSFGRS